MRAQLQQYEGSAGGMSLVIICLPAQRAYHYSEPSHHFRTHSLYAKSGAAVICVFSLDISCSQIKGVRMKLAGEQYADVQPATKGTRVPWISPMSWNVGSHENHTRCPCAPPLAAISWCWRYGSAQPSTKVISPFYAAERARDSSIRKQLLYPSDLLECNSTVYVQGKEVRGHAVNPSGKFKLHSCSDEVHIKVLNPFHSCVYPHPITVARSSVLCYRAGGHNAASHCLLDENKNARSYRL